MPITFGSQEEFHAFCQVFELRNSVPAASRTKPLASQPTNKLASRAKSSNPVKAPSKTTRTAPKTPAVKRENSLTDQVKASIQALIDSKTAFSANDVYSKLAENNPNANKATVLSLSSKLLATQYHLPSEERPSAGIRPMRVYLPEGSQTT